MNNPPSAISRFTELGAREKENVMNVDRGFVPENTLDKNVFPFCFVFANFMYVEDRAELMDSSNIIFETFRSELTVQGQLNHLYRRAALTSHPKLRI